MHKKYSKYGSKDTSHKKSSKREHLKYRKSEASVHGPEISQNSKCEAHNSYGENKENLTSNFKYIQRYKHIRAENTKMNECYGRKQEKYSSHSHNKPERLSYDDERISRHREKSSQKEKREKEKFSNVEKYLEELNRTRDVDKVPHRSRSFSVDSRERALRRKDKHIRREKTFHIEESHRGLDEKKSKGSKAKEGKEEKRQKHKQKESIKEKDKESFQKQVMYCQVETKSPFQIEKKYDFDNLYHNEKSVTKTRKSSSKEAHRSFCGDGKYLEEAHRPHIKKSKERRSSELIKYSPRKSKIKEQSKHLRDLKSIVSLGPYDKYFVEKKSQGESKQHYLQEKRRRHKHREESAPPREDNVNKDVVRESRKKKKHVSENIVYRSRDNSVSKQEQLREKIEDDLKGYFSKIQTLIDKKLEYILHSNSKEDKTDDIAENLREVVTKRRDKSPDRSRHPSHSRKEKKPHRNTEETRAKLETRKAYLEKKEEGSVDREYKRHKRHKTPKQSDRKSPERSRALDNEEEHRRHRRHKSPKPQAHADKDLNSDVLLAMLKTTRKSTEEGESKAKSHRKGSKSPERPHRESSSNRRTPDKTTHGRIRNDFRVEGIEPAKLLDSHHKKPKKRLDRPMNLECKTVSIIGIPSQIKESLIFSQAQTSTSMNAINPAEDTIEKKKQSKRFKLYYKYSVADNNCSNSGSGHSSDRKSVISDSYRILSDNSEGRTSDNVEKIFDVKEEEPTKDSGKVIFVMKRENVTRNVYGDVLQNGIMVDHHRRKHRKHRIVTPEDSKLNNILEESSNICFVEEPKETVRQVNNEVNCKYFKVLNTSSSDCNVDPPRKHLLSKWNVPSGFPGTLDGRSKLSESKRAEVEKSSHRPRKTARDSEKYSSKSDIDISYDSVHLDKNYKAKVNKGSKPPVLKTEDARFNKYSRNTAPGFVAVDGYGGKLDREFLVLDDEQYAFKKRIIESAETGPRKYQNDAIVCSQIAYMPPTMNTKFLEASPVQFPEANNVENAKRYYVSEKQVISSSCQSNWKELIDVGVEANTNNENVAEKKKQASKTPGDTKVNHGQRHYSAVRREKSPSRAEKSPPKTNEIAVEANLPFTSKLGRQNSNLEKKSLPPCRDNLRSPDDSKLRRPYKRQKSDVVSVKKPLDIGFKTKLQSNIPSTRGSKRPSTASDKSRNEKPEIVPPKEQLQTASKMCMTVDNPPPSPATEKSGTDKAEHTPPKDQQDSNKKCVPINTSQLTVTEKSRLPIAAKQIRSASCSNKSKTEDKSLRSSQSALNLGMVSSKNLTEKTNSSLSVRLDEFAEANFLNSNSQSLEKYAAKSIIGDANHASRLFLTKDFSREVNSYQRRKMYDEGIRKKMKKKIQNRIAPPQVFEVRFLTYEHEKSNEGSVETNDIAEKSAQTRSKLPTFTCNSKRSSFKKKFNLTSRRSSKNINNKPLGKESGYQFGSGSSRNPFGPISDVDQLNKFRRKKFADKTIEEIFVKGSQLNDPKLSSIFDYCKQLYDIQSSSLIIKDSTGSLDGKPINNDKLHDDEKNDENNFLHLVDYLCKSIVNYCSSNFHLPPEGGSHELLRKGASTSITDHDRESDTKTNGDDLDEDKFKTLPKNEKEDPPPEESNDLAENTLNQVATCLADQEAPASTGHIHHEEDDILNKINGDSPRSLGSSYLSCPALARTASSFEFLYEEESDLSKEAIVSSLTKPLDTILGYAFNDNNSILRTDNLTVFRRKVDQLSTSPTESGDSGYWSTCSRKFSSVSSFFKRPNIASLFKPVPRLQIEPSKELLVKSIPSMTSYNIMAQKCHEYAQKVRKQSEHKLESEEQFQEIPLNVLLGKTLESFNSNCSLCKGLSKVDFKGTKGDSFESDTSLLVGLSSSDSVVQSESELETLIYYGNETRQPSLEIVKLKKVQSRKSDLGICTSSSSSHDIIECQLILSNTNLNTCSLTLIDVGQTSRSNYSVKNSTKENVRTTLKHQLNNARHKSKLNLTNILSSTLVTASDEEKAKEFLNETEVSTPEKANAPLDLPSMIQNPTDIRKSLAKKFFENLLQVYDREINVTTRLFQDDEFVSHLLESLNTVNGSAKHLSKKKGKEKMKNFRGKLKGCIDKVFSQKTGDSNSCKVTESDKDLDRRFEKTHQENLKVLAYNARRYFSLFVQAVQVNKDINDEMKIFGLLKLLDRIENGDFSILRKEEDVNFEEEIKDQVREGFLNIYKASLKEAKKCKRSLTEDDLKLITAFICKYRIGLLSKTDLIAAYIGRGLFKTESQLRAAVTYLMRSKAKDVDLKDFEEHCNLCTNCEN